MAVTYNGNPVTSISYNGNTVTTGLYNGTNFFAGSGGSIMIVPNWTVETEESFVPPPYDSSGYNYNDSAPEKTNSVQLSLGDVTTYNTIMFNFDTNGSLNSYGIIEATATIGNTTVKIFDEMGQMGVIRIDVSSLTGNQYLVLNVKAKSLSSYRWYISKCVLNIQNLMATVGSQPAPEPAPADDFVLGTDISFVPGPYDSEGYNYGAEAPTYYLEKTINLGDVTNKSQFTFYWYIYHYDNDSGETSWSMNNYGNIYISYTDAYGTEQFILNKSIGMDVVQDELDPDSHGSVVMDLTDITGNLSITFKVYAKSESNYRYYWSRAIVDVHDLELV